MVALFRNTSFSSIFLLIVLSLLVHAHFFVSPTQIVVDDDGLLSFILKKYIQPLPSVYLWLLYIGVLLLQAIRLNLVLNENKMFHHNNYTAAMAYIVITGFFSEWCIITPAFIANTFIIWILIQLFKLYNNPSPKTLLFNTGLIIGISVICYHPTAILIIVVLFALAVVRPFRIAEWLILLMGTIAPLYLIISFLFLSDNLKLINQFLPNIQIGLPHFINNAWLLYAALVLFISLLAGLFFYANASKRMVIQIRKNWNILLVMLLLMLFIPFVFTTTAMHTAVMLIIPLAAFIANAYLYPKRLLFPNLLFLLALAAIIHNNWIIS
ncbi:MAG: hypothetical protein JSR09_00320 [Bacteroidetes bacterium]|nr:hypothetical protein [Bacteroidota bacterium]MBS1648128.1 hypothetical protein [Bacteroidota bacterium]